jgi:hypothetical protein
MKELTIIFFCSFKFAATFPVAIYLVKMTQLETLVYTNTGGVAGTFSFMYLSAYLIRMWNKYMPRNLKRMKKKKQVFTPKNRRIVRIKMRYGIWGIVILSPVLLSIPIGSFLMVKYFGLKIKNLLLLLAGQVAWSVVFVVFYYYVKMIL